MTGCLPHIPAVDSPPKSKILSIRSVSPLLTAVSSFSSRPSAKDTAGRRKTNKPMNQLNAALRHTSLTPSPYFGSRDVSL